ncbi:MAG: cytochrome-c oxidase, cbb3-type subunit III [Woeseiaceae bacterium]|nr:cytochrome-c oxidase, cbb3-type subunit III [Woeseiaceae bacterium]
MSSAWSWYVAIGTIASLLACFWLIFWTNRQRQSDEAIREAEAHVWDEDIRELNNPLPMWWLWLFVLTLIWGVGYFALYPSLVVYDGALGWSQEEQYERQMAAAEERYGPVFARYGAMPVEELVNNPEALEIGASLYANYCSQCHGANALGAPGFPNLTDDNWNWGNSPAAIEQTLKNGRRGIMPALGSALQTDEAVNQMVNYVRGMVDGQDTSSPAHGRYMTLCIACHGPDGGGVQAMGAPALNDDTWLYGSSPAAVRTSIVEGRTGVMPAHQALLGDDRIRILAAYVLSLSD